MGHIRNVYIILVGKILKGRDHLENLGIDRRLIPKKFLRKQCLRVWTGFIQLRTGTDDGLL
jgi:hypothetical protein